MNILIVCHSYYPARNARVFRWAALAEHWASRGHEVVVITGALPGEAATESVRGVTVRRVGGQGLESLRFRLRSSSRSSIGESTAGRIRDGIGLGKGFLKWLHDTTWKKIYWPDYAMLWVWSAIKEARAIIQSNPDQILVTVSLPFAGHVVGLFLRRAFPKLPWIMDIGDPFAFMVEAPVNNHAIYGSVNFAAERRALASADGVSVTTDGTLRRYVAAFPEVGPKIVEIPPLANLAGIDRSSLEIGDPNVIRLIFLGSLYRNVRGPEQLLALLLVVIAKTPRRVELHLYGNHGDYDDIFKLLDSHTRDHLVLHGLVSRADAIMAMRSATALVNIGNDTTYQLPSKLVEYAAMGKPIINVVTGHNDSSIAFLKRHPCVENVIGEEARFPATAERVVSFLEAPRATGTCEADPQWLNQFSLESIAKAYEDLIATVRTRAAMRHMRGVK